MALQIGNRLIEPERPRSAGPDGDGGRGGRRFFYGWVVVGALTVIMTIVSGSRLLFGVVLKPMSEQFGWDRASLAGAVMLGMIVLSICQPAAGLLVDRIGPKRMLVVGCALLGLSLIPLSRVSQLWQVYVVYGVVVSIALAATSPVNAAALVSRWFHAKRGAAMSIATSGSAFGQLLIVPIATWILTLTTWQMTYRLLAVALVVGMVPLGLLVLRDAPGAKTAASSRRAAGEGVTLGRAIRTFDFWCLAFGFVVCGWTMAFPNVHFLAWADDMGMPAVHAADIVAVTALFSIAGSLSLGVIADRHRRGAILALVYFLRGIAFLLLVVLPTGNLIFLYALVLGISWTATTPLTAAIAADRFGAKHIGLIFGSLYTFMNLGFGLGSFIDGVIYEREHAYALALVANIGFGLLGAIGAFRIGDGPLPELRAALSSPREREPAALAAPAD